MAWIPNDIVPGPEPAAIVRPPSRFRLDLGTFAGITIEIPYHALAGRDPVLIMHVITNLLLGYIPDPALEYTVFAGREIGNGILFTRLRAVARAYGVELIYKRKFKGALELEPELNNTVPGNQLFAALAMVYKGFKILEELGEKNAKKS